MARLNRAQRGGRETRVDGLTEAKAALAGLPDAFRDVLTRYIAEGAGIIEAEAKRRVRKRSGTLAQHIGTNIRADGLQASVGAGKFYARHLELGTKKMRARPFLYPAFRRGARHIRKEARGIVGDLGAKGRFKVRRFKAKKVEP